MRWGAIVKAEASAWRAISMGLALCALATACVNTKASSTPSATASLGEVIVDIGQRATTGAGNLVTVHAFLSPVRSTQAPGAGMIFSAADIEACAGSKASSRTGVS